MTAVPKIPDPKHITMSVDGGPEVAIAKTGNDDAGLETIRQYAVDLTDLGDQEKAAKEVLETIQHSWPEYQEVERLTDELEKAREALKARRNRDHHYTEQTEKVAAVKREKAEAREILSDYLVANFKQTGERQVLMNPATGDAREVIVTAKLGRETKYQTSLDLAPGDPQL